MRYLLLLLPLLPLIALAVANPLMLIDQGKSDYRIVIPAQAIPAERYAAEELQTYLARISGVKLPIVTDVEKPVRTEILLGDTTHLRALKQRIDFTHLGSDGFTLKTVDKRLIIAGGRPRGTLYGVYEVLEARLGVRWFAPGVESVPKTSRVLLPALDETQIPSFEVRDVFWKAAMNDPDFACRMRLNGQHYGLTAKHGGPAAVYYPFVHSLDQLVPPALYAEHPEYFSLINGKRVNGYVERCLTNPEVVKIATATVRQWLKQHPEANIISVSQNDTMSWCQCDACRAVNEREGSTCATMLQLVNVIADDIAHDYPNVRIDTLAYMFTRRPPLTIRPRPNVIIRFCSIECCFSHPFDSCVSEENKRFREDMNAWQPIAPQIYVWDYVTNFANYQQPFPNYDVLQANAQFFRRHGVRGLFEQGNYQSVNGEMEPMRVYVLSKVLWNIDADVNRTHLREFLRGYYGAGGAAVRTYMNAFLQPVRELGYHAHENDPTTAPYLTSEAIDKSEQALEAAIANAENDDFRARLQTVMLSVWYTKFTSGRVTGDARTDLIRKFLQVARASKIVKIREGEFLDAWAKRMGVE